MVNGPTGTPLRVQLVSKPGPATTGIGRYADELVRGLGAMEVCMRQASLSTPVPRVLNRSVRAIGYDLDAFARSYPLRADARRGHITHLTSQTLATLLLTQRLPRPVVVTVHDILPYLLRDDPTLRVYPHRLAGVMDKLAMHGLRRADRLIADSYYTKQTIVDALHLPAERIHVVHLGVDAERFAPQPPPDSFRARYGLPVDRRYVLFVGSEDPRKDLATLIRALPLLRRRISNAVLLKVGAPAFADERRKHLALCQDLGVTNDVRWFDEVPEEDLPLFYCTADVFAFPSRYEGFGLPVLEAMACGTPVVAVHASSVPELVGEVGVTVEPENVGEMADALVSVLGVARPDPNLLVDWARRFSWQQTVLATKDVYQAALSSDTHR